MSSELRTKIMALIECCDTELVSSVTSTADHILALLTPPATAKLPDDRYGGDARARAEEDTAALRAAGLVGDA